MTWVCAYIVKAVRVLSFFNSSARQHSVSVQHIEWNEELQAREEEGAEVEPEGHVEEAERRVDLVEPPVAGAALVH